MMLASRSLNSTLDRMLTLNRVLDEAFASSLNGSSESRVWVPALDVVERQDAYVIALEIPGCDPSSIDISFEKNVLSVTGNKPMGFELGSDKEFRVYSAERVTGNFERSIRLPEFVDGEKISAEFTHGVLVLTVPKVQAARSKKIQVKGVEQQKQIKS
jgi:HSP20 family protein